MHPNIHGWLGVNNRSLLTNTRLGGCWPLWPALSMQAVLAVGTYTAHMTGVLSALADHLVLGNLLLAAASLGVLLAFCWAP